MQRFTYTIKDPVGIHARPAGLLAKTAKGYSNTTITITKGGETVNASQVIMLLGLGVKKGSTVTVAAEGSAEDEAIAAMEKFFKENL